MRVLYFTRDYTPHDFRFLTSLAESGQEVVFLRLERAGRQLEDRSLPPAIRQVHWSDGGGKPPVDGAAERGGCVAGGGVQQPFRWRDLAARLGSLKRLLSDIRPDILHAGPVQTAAFLAALTGFRPLVTMSWGSDLLKDAGRTWLYRQITRYTLSRSTVLVGDCQAVRDKAASFGFPIARTFMFPWGIDLDRFSPDDTLEVAASAREFRSRMGWQENFVLLSLRSWEPVYGVDVMLRGFARAARENPDLRLILLGGGSQSGLVHQIIQENGLENQVYLGGQVNQADLPVMYRTADLYASASHSDGSSVSLMEALGCGLPVLVTDIPSNREWIADGVQGWLFPDGDDQAVARGILRAASLAKEHPEKLSAMCQAARSRAEQRADWKKNFQVLLEAYDQAARLANHKGDSRQS